MENTKAKESKKKKSTGKNSSLNGQANRVASYGYDMEKILENIDQFTRSVIE